jgi:membrane protease YdiL (CAAX protease family)
MSTVLLVVLVVLVVGVGAAYTLRLPGSLGLLPLWMGLAIPYLGLVLLSVLDLHRRKLVRPLLGFRPGDPSIGVGVALVSLIGTWLGSKLLIPPQSPIHAWVLQVFLLVGDTSSWFTVACLVLLAACEEIVWRGFVQTRLTEQLGARRGWIAGAVLYALAHIATLVTLEDAVVGYNPLIVLLAFGCGLCWAFLRERTGRLLPGFFSHAAFTYLATQYLWRFI